MNFARTITEISNKYEGNPTASQAVQDMQRCFVDYLEQILRLDQNHKNKGAVPMTEETITKELIAIIDKYDVPATESIAEDITRALFQITTAATDKVKQLPQEFIAIRTKYKDNSEVSADLQTAAVFALDLVAVCLKDLRVKAVKHVA